MCGGQQELTRAYGAQLSIGSHQPQTDLVVLQVVPRVCVVGGKAAPGYEMAKRIIKLVGAVGTKINSDPAIKDLLKLVFVPDYNVSLAEVIIPGALAMSWMPCQMRHEATLTLGVRGLSF